MRKLPTKPSENQRTIIAACEDFYNGVFPHAVALTVMNRTTRLRTLTDDENRAVWYIKANLADSEYRDTL